MYLDYPIIMYVKMTKNNIEEAFLWEIFQPSPKGRPPGGGDPVVFIEEPTHNDRSNIPRVRGSS